jgi:hypothetical protein
MHQGLIAPLDANLALNVARISSDLKLPLADSVIVATARADLGLIWTQDAHFKGLEGSDTPKRSNHPRYFRPQRHEETFSTSPLAPILLPQAPQLLHLRRRQRRERPLEPRRQDHPGGVFQLFHLVVGVHHLRPHGHGAMPG